MGMGKVVEWRQQSEGQDRNRAIVAWEIIDSDNEIYLMSFKQITMQREKRNKQNT
jgi:hypothetical protein